MTGWSLDPVGGWWLAIATLLALAPLLAVGPSRRRLSWGRRFALVLLRAATLAMLLGFLLRPALEHRTTRKLPGTLLVLSDASRSMTVADAAQHEPRYAALCKALADAADPLAELAETWTIRGYAFGRDVLPVDFAQGKFKLPKTPTGNQTAIGAAIDDVLAREGQQRIVAVVLLSDGAQRAFAPRDVPPQSAVRRLAADGIPLYTMAFGQPSLGEQSDLRLSDLRSADAVFAGTPANIEGVVTSAGYANQEVRVELKWEKADGKMETVDARKITILPGKTRYPVRLTYSPAAAGEYKVTLAVESPAGELVTSNNSQSTFVTVLKGGVKILYLAGADRIGGTPGIEPRFVRKALAANPDFDMHYEAINYRSVELDQRDRLRAERYDVYLLEDVDSSAFTMRTWREMVQQVERGAGLAMLGGFHSFGPGGFLSSPLEGALPIVMGGAERQNFGEPPRPDMHIGPVTMLPVARGGQVHPIMEVAPGGDSVPIWVKLPPLDGANRFDRLRLKPNAEVVAEGDDPSRSPLLVISAFGDGRTAALAADSTWHWQLEGFGEIHRRFWRQLVLWLAKKDETAGERVWVKLDQRRYQQGSRVDFALGATGEGGKPLDNAEFQVHVIGPNGRSAEIRARRSGKQMAASFSEADAPGDYRITVEATAEGKPIGSASARFSVSDQDVELDQPAAEPLLLKSLANLTSSSGGEALAPEELPDLLAKLKEKAAEFEEDIVETITLWDRWPTLLTFVGLMSSEWFLRKKWGLA